MRALVRQVVFAVLCFTIAAQALARPRGVISNTCPAAPALVAPPDGSQQPFGPVTLEWSASAGATSYDLWGGIDGSAPGLIDTVTGTSKTLTIEPGRLINWWVVAKAASCPDAPSAERTFTTSCPTEGATLQIPPPGDSYPANHNITFAWFPVPGAASYDLEVSDDNGGSWTVVVENHTATSFTTSLTEGNWLWGVRANFDGDCEPLYSDHRQLFVGLSCDDKPAPVLSEPANGATKVSTRVRFKWEEAAGATLYRVVAAIDGGAPRVVAQTADNDATVSLSGTVVKWAVEALFPDECSTFSDEWQFTLEADDSCPSNPEKAQLIAPPDGAAGLASPVTFSWHPVAGAIRYRVLFGTGNGQPQSLGETDQTSLVAAVSAGSGFWLVQTLFGEGCPSTLSERRAFTVTSGATCDNAPPTLQSPANGATSVESPVQFSWTGVQGATSYRLFVAAGDDDFEFYGDTTDTALQRFVPAGAVRWFVVAGFAACPDLRSPVFTFVAAGRAECANASIALTAPAEGAVTSSPARLAWSPVAGALSYRVWVSLNGDAPVNLARTTSTEVTLSLPAGEMTWYVEAQRDKCESVLSAKGHFRISEGANCAGNVAPVLVSPKGPVADPTHVTTPVTLTWLATERAIGYRVWVGSNGAFQDVALTKETSTQVALDPGHYGWYVEALFESCGPRQSATEYFEIEETEERCSGAVPAAIAPAQGESVTSPVTFQWTAAAGAEKYRVFASIDGADPQLLGTTADTELQRLLRPGAITWAVEAVFDDCPSTLSSRVSFTVPQASNCPTEGAQLVAPANGAQGVQPDVDFTWDPVSGAVKYAVVVESGEGSSTVIGTTTDTHLAKKLPRGRIEWWVVALFAGCDPLESAHFAFSVAQDQDCNLRRPILITPAGRGPDVTSPIHFAWTEVPKANGYRVWVEQGETTPPAMVASTADTTAVVDLPPGTYEWWVEATVPDCSSVESAEAEFTVGDPVACGVPRKPDGQVVGQALSATKYRFRWTPVPNADLYEVQESTALDFANAETFTTSETFLQFAHEVTGAPVQYFYRVRAASNCNDARGAYSNAVGVFVTAPRTNNASAEIGAADTVVQKLVLPASPDPVRFTVTTDKPWITVTPSTGTLHTEPVTLTLTADPSFLALGTNTATVSVAYAAASTGGVQTLATTGLNLPVSVSLVTPVQPSGKGTPPPDSLIFAVVGHAQGANESLFESDIRVTNVSAQTMKYLLNFTPSNTVGTLTGSSSTIELGPNATMALDDIVASLFGSGTTSSATGMLEVRPLTVSTSLSAGLVGGTPIAGAVRELITAASSRTYNFTPSGTFGQFIPATRFSDFVGRAIPGSAPAILSLQQVAQSDSYRANFGFAEASGNPADLMVRVYDASNTLLQSIPVSLRAGEHRQINGMLPQNGIANLADGRVEVEVIGGDGKVTAYVSEVDNRTNDPLLVSPVVKGAVTSDRYVVPGVAYLANTSAFWVTDLRVFNAGATATPATVTFYPQGNPSAAVARQITLNPGEIEVLDNVIGNFFGQPNGAGGSLAVTTPAPSQLTVTGRTYNSTANGTYGQYIPGVTPAQSAGVADRALQLLQLEQSSRFRTNIGLAETSGQPAVVDVTAIIPDSIATPVVQVVLAPNEFRQFSLGDFGLGNAAYNARVTVKVVGGSGRVTAYGSAIDAITQDPTYVPAQ